MNWMDEIGREYQFTARFFGVGLGRKMLLKDVQSIDGTPFRDHLLIPYTNRFRRKNLRRGDCITLRGKVNRYFKKQPGLEHLPRHPSRLITKLQITNIHIIHIQRIKS